MEGRLRQLPDDTAVETQSENESLKQLADSIPSGNPPEQGQHRERTGRRKGELHSNTKLISTCGADALEKANGLGKRLASLSGSPQDKATAERIKQSKARDDLQARLKQTSQPPRTANKRELTTRLTSLRARLAALETQRSLFYRGTGAVSATAVSQSIGRPRGKAPARICLAALRSSPKRKAHSRTTLCRGRQKYQEVLTLDESTPTSWQSRCYSKPSRRNWKKPKPL
jgi:hypothetical protein